MKIFLKIVFLLMVYSCGYQPLLVQKSDIIFFNETNIIGESKISKAILKNLNNYKGEGSDASLEIESNYSKSISSKNKKGDPTKNRLSISVELKISDKNKKALDSQVFIESFEYTVQDNKFEMKQYEKNIKQNLVEDISDQILIYLAGI